MIKEITTHIGVMDVKLNYSMEKLESGVYRVKLEVITNTLIDEFTHDITSPLFFEDKHLGSYHITPQEQVKYILEAIKLGDEEDFFNDLFFDTFEDRVIDLVNECFILCDKQGV